MGDEKSGCYGVGIRLCVISILISGSLFFSCENRHRYPAALAVPSEQLPQRMTIQKREAFPPDRVYRIADLDADGFSEYLNINESLESIGKSPAHITFSDLDNLRAGNQINFKGLIYATIFDWDGDDKKEVFVAEQLDDDLFLHIYSHEGDNLATVPAVIDAPAASDPTWRCIARPAGLIDGNRDGRPDLLFIVHTNEAYQPRMVKLLDIQTLKWIWEYPCGMVFEQLSVSDADLDGEPEIYAKVSAPGNGTGEYVNGTDDGHSWFIVLSAEGRPLQKMPMGGEFSSFLAKPFDMDHDGRPEVALIKMSRNSKVPEKSMIAFWDPVQMRIIHRREYEKHLFDVHCFMDVDDDGCDELIVFWSDGRIEARNRTNDIVKEIALGESSIGDPILEDLDDDGKVELLIAGKSRIYLLSHRLNLQASTPIEYATVETALAGRGHPKWIIARCRDQRISLQVERNYKEPIEIAWPFVIAFCTGGAFIFLLVTLQRMHRQRDPKRWAPRAVYDHLDSGLLILDPAGQIVSLNERLRKMLNLADFPSFPCNREALFKGPQFTLLHEWIDTTPLSVPPPPLLLEKAFAEKDVQVIIRSLRDNRGKRRGFLLVFEDITSLSQSSRAIAWTHLAQRLAHQIKTPLSSVLLAVQRLQMEYQRDGISKAKVYDRYIDYVAEEVARIRQITDGFLKLAQIEKPRLTLVNLNSLITETLEKYRTTLVQGYQFKADLDPDLPAIYADEQQLKIVLNILIDNSVDAMEEGGCVTLSSRLRQAFAADGARTPEESILIECADTGRGIPADNIPKLYDLFFTTKRGGTGLGLPIVKKIVEDHHGIIQVHSQVGIGTVFSISLPV